MLASAVALGLGACARAEWQLAIETVADSPDFAYDGAAWAQPAPYEDSMGNRLLAPFFATPLTGLRLEANGRGHDFALGQKDVGRTMSSLLRDDAAEEQELCSGNSTDIKVFASAAVASAVRSQDFWGMVPRQTGEPLYCIDRLLLHARRGSLRFRLGFLRDGNECCCCPGSADGLGMQGHGGSVSSGTIEANEGGRFVAMKVYAIPVAARLVPSCCNFTAGRQPPPVPLFPPFDDLATVGHAGFCMPCTHTSDFQRPGARDLRMYIYPLRNKYHADIVRAIQNTGQRKGGGAGCDFGLTACTEHEWEFTYSWKRQYATEVAILLKLLASPNIVADPADANLFVVPWLSRTECAIVGCHNGLCGNLKDTVFEDLPYYNEETKARHLFIAVSEASMQQVEIGAMPLVATLGPAMHQPLQGHHRSRPGGAGGGGDERAIHGHIVMPSTGPHGLTDAMAKFPVRGPRPTLFYFAGDIANFWRELVVKQLRKLESSQPGSVRLHTDPSYDGIARQPPPRASPDDLAKGMSSSVFCPIPPGDAPHTQRLFTTMLHGCIPVVLAFPTSLGPPGSVSWWGEEGPPWEWSVPGAGRTLPPEERLPWEVLVVQVPVRSAVRGAFVRAVLRSRNVTLEERWDALERMRSSMAFDYTGAVPDAFSLLMRQVGVFMQATAQLERSAVPCVHCQPSPVVPVALCQQLPSRWQRRCLETMWPCGQVVCLTIPRAGKPLQHVRGETRDVCDEVQQAEAGLDIRWPSFPPPVQGPLWRVAAVTWSTGPLPLPSNRSSCSRAIPGVLTRARRWLGGMAKRAGRTLVLDLTVLATGCTAAGETLCPLASPTALRPHGWVQGRMACIPGGALSGTVVGDSHFVRKGATWLERLWVALLGHVRRLASTREDTDWLVLAPQAASALRLGRRRSDVLAEASSPFRAWLYYPQAQPRRHIDISMCDLWWRRIAHNCVADLPLRDEEVPRLAFAGMALPGRALRLPPPPRWRVAQMIDTVHMLHHVDDVLGFVWVVAMGAWQRHQAATSFDPFYEILAQRRPVTGD